MCHLGIFLRHETNAVALVPGAPRATDAMDVVLDAIGHVVVDHVADVFDVDGTGEAGRRECGESVSSSTQRHNSTTTADR